MRPITKNYIYSYHLIYPFKAQPMMCSEAKRENSGVSQISGRTSTPVPRPLDQHVGVSGHCFLPCGLKIDLKGLVGDRR